MTRLLSAAFAVVLTAAAAFVAQPADPTAVRMAAAAEKWLASLPAEQRAAATFPADSPERLKWNFVPLQDKQRSPTRRGVRLEVMTADARQKALALLAAGTSETGYQQAVDVMNLESVLNIQEGGRGNVRNPDWYFVTVFGTPGPANRWGWRFEGHHLSINYLCDGGRVVSCTPCFFGSNPAIVRDGPRAGLQPLKAVDELGRQLFTSLDAGQKATARVDKLHPEVTATPAASPGTATGVSAKAMTPPQRALLERLVKAYLERFPEPVAQSEWDRVRANWDAVTFALGGEPDAGKPTTYRVHGPNFLVEFLNQQNGANHVHSVWRTLPRDFAPAE